MRITQSMLGNADKCLLSMQYTLDPPAWFRRTGGADRALGTGFHAGLELYYDERRRVPELLPDTDAMISAANEVFDLSMERDLYDDTEIEVFKWSDKVPDVSTAHDLIAALITAYVDNRWYWPPEYQVVETEANHTVELDGRQFKLGADLVLMDPHRWIVLVDHKTANRAWDEGKHKPRKQNQAPLYTATAREHYRQLDPAGVRFVFDIIMFPTAKNGPRFDRRISDPGPDHEAAVLKKAADIVELYETVHVRLGRDLPANPASTLCNPKWCDFWDGCPHGAALDTFA